MLYSKPNFRSTLNYFYICSILIYTNTCSFSQFHNQIDEVRTVEDVNTIIHNTIGNIGYDVSDSISISDKDYKKLFDSLNIKIWAKGDFDNNSYTDLLTISRNNHAFCILDSGNNKFYVKHLTTRFNGNQLFTVSNDKKLINYYQIERFRTSSLNRDSMYQSYIKKGTLAFKFDGFIENNTTPKDYHIQSIEYFRSGCYGTCPVFKLKIYANRTISYEAILFNKAKKGNYQGKIEKTQYQTLIDCLNYIDFPSLNDKYFVDWTDDASSSLKIIYDNGKTKTINDYGLIGTFGLKHINDLLLEIAENKKWK